MVKKKLANLLKLLVAGARKHRYSLPIFKIDI